MGRKKISSNPSITIGKKQEIMDELIALSPIHSQIQSIYNHRRTGIKTTRETGMNDQNGWIKKLIHIHIYLRLQIVNSRDKERKG